MPGPTGFVWVYSLRMKPVLVGRSWLRGSLVLAVVLSQAGCTSAYQPRRGPRLSVVLDAGSLAYQRDGQTFQHGLFGGGLVEAVDDDPAARDAAETYQGRMIGGFVANIVGFGCFLGGTAWAMSSSSSSSSNQLVDSERTVILLGGVGCLFAGAITGSILLLSAQPYQWDAINIYNDNLEMGRSRGRPSPGAPPGPAGAVGAPAPSP
jgi:hypothetical protein